MERERKLKRENSLYFSLALHYLNAWNRLLSSTKQEIQENTSRLNAEAGKVGLRIIVQKTKVMRVNTRNQEDIEDVDPRRIRLFGGKVYQEGRGIKDLKNRILKARGAFARLKKIWRSNNVSTRTKMRMCKTLVRRCQSGFVPLIKAKISFCNGKLLELGLQHRYDLDTRGKEKTGKTEDHLGPVA